MARADMRKLAVWIGQMALVVALVGLVGRSVYDNWTELSDLDVTFRLRPTWIVAAAFTIWASYGILIEAWRRVLGGWGYRIGYRSALRIWCFSNLGRYLPGKVWSIATMAVLAKQSGVAGWAAAASAVVMQVLAVGTGAIIVSIGAPGAASPFALATALILAICGVAALVSESLAVRMGKVIRPGHEFRALPIGAAVVGTAVTLLSWVFYGLAFWMLAQGTFDLAGISIVRATGVFAAGYIAGLLALFAPGGLGVRELVYVALLAPVFGSAGALALSVAARLLLTGTEACAAVFALFVNRFEERSVDTSA